MAEISYILGTNGIWTDHLTTLDPYPINNDGNDDFPATIMDAPAEYTYSSVLFADNYWQDLGAGAYFGDPDGEPVYGAYVRQLTDLSGGYGLDGDHENVHLWYHGTVDLVTPANDTEATITGTERANWWVPYEEEGVVAGFYYSRIGGGNRTNTQQPAGAGSYAIVDGYNQQLNFGAGNSANRTMLSANNGTWPNLIKFDVVGTNIVIAGQSIATKLFYQYGGPSNSVTAQFFFDSDLNPYNTNGSSVVEISLPNTGTNSVYYDNVNLTTTNVPPGVYAIYGRISDGTHTRYLYTPELVEIVSVQAPVLGLGKINSGQFVIGVNGVPSQTIVLQASTDLRVWTALATNTLASEKWNFTNNVSQSIVEQFYRAILVP
jgi:hypothetical protein